MFSTLDFWEPLHSEFQQVGCSLVNVTPTFISVISHWRITIFIRQSGPPRMHDHPPPKPGHPSSEPLPRWEVMTHKWFRRSLRSARQRSTRPKATARGAWPPNCESNPDLWQGYFHTKIPHPLRVSPGALPGQWRAWRARGDQGGRFDTIGGPMQSSVTYMCFPFSAERVHSHW